MFKAKVTFNNRAGEGGYEIEFTSVSKNSEFSMTYDYNETIEAVYINEDEHNFILEIEDKEFGVSHGIFPKDFVSIKLIE